MNEDIGGTTSNKHQISAISFLPLLVLAILVTLVAQAFHETGHRMVYQLTGHSPVWGFTKLVQIWDTPPINPAGWVAVRGPDGEPGWLRLSSPVASTAEEAVSAAAGPLAGLFGALLGLALALLSKKLVLKQVGLAFSLSASLAAVLYYLRSPLRTGGDEYDLAISLGVSKSLVEIPLALAFAICLIWALRELPSWRARATWLGTLLLGSAAMGIAMMSADSLVIAQVDAGNPWFRPILGVTFPVFLANGLALIGIWLWVRWQTKHTRLSEQRQAEETFQVGRVGTK
ncbi:MAG TPA: hypothetical protein PL105_12820 [Caldilineaceae bacterium]|nr:hypothetical protein [Caldilineaceae bacterium]